jgi:hypothetical protein
MQHCRSMDFSRKPRGGSAILEGPLGLGQRSPSDRGLASPAPAVITYPMVILTNERYGMAISLLATTSGVEFGMKAQALTPPGCQREVGALARKPSSDSPRHLG